MALRSLDVSTKRLGYERGIDAIKTFFTLIHNVPNLLVRFYLFYLEFLSHFPPELRTMANIAFAHHCKPATFIETN